MTSEARQLMDSDKFTVAMLATKQTQRRNNVFTTKLQRQDVITTLLVRCVFAGYCFQGFPSGHMTFIQRRLNVGATSSRGHMTFIHCRLNVAATSSRGHMTFIQLRFSVDELRRRCINR